MENLVRINAAAIVSSSGDSVNHSQEFYINGKWMDKFWTDNVSSSVDLTARHHLFSVYDGMTGKFNEKISISIARELKRLQQRFETSPKSIDIKLDQLCECVDETNNLIHSIAVTGASNPVTAHKRAMAGVIVFEGAAAAVTMGNSRAFLFHDGSLKLMNEDLRKAERLIRSGLISNEQAQSFKGKVSSAADELRKDVKKSRIFTITDGDIIVLCCSKLCEVLDEDYLLHLLMHNDDTSEITSLIIKKALENGAQGPLSLLLARVEKAHCSTNFSSQQQCFEEELAIDDERPVKRPNIRARAALKSAARKLAIVLLIAVLVSTGWAVIGKANIVNGIKNTFSFVFGIGGGDNTLSKAENVGVTVPTTSTEQSVEVTQNDVQDASTQQVDNNIEQTEQTETDPQDSAITEQRTYTIKDGDTLERISKEVYGDGRRYQEILDANKDLNPSRLKIGKVIVIP